MDDPPARSRADGADRTRAADAPNGELGGVMRENVGAQPGSTGAPTRRVLLTADVNGGTFRSFAIDSDRHSVSGGAWVPLRNVVPLVTRRHIINAQRPT